MDRQEYKQNMDQVSDASLGLEMVNHAQGCEACRLLLEQAQQNVIKHMLQSR